MVHQLSALALCPSVDKCASEDLRPCDEGATGSERSPRELLGRDHHCEVVLLASGCKAPVLLGDRQAEAAHVREPRNDLLRNISVLSVDLLGARCYLAFGKAPEGLSHELEVRVEM
jgi:hypothetical protein